MKAIDRRALEMCHKVSRCDDTLGQYSDHEGQQDGPVWHFWEKGYEIFSAHCERAIEDHKEAIKVWRKFKKLNEKRKGLAVMEGIKA